MYCALEQRNENIDAFEDIITAELPTAEDCAILNVAPSTPLLVKTRKGYNERGQLVEYTIAKHIARYYQYIVENSK